MHESAKWLFPWKFFGLNLEYISYCHYLCYISTQSHPSWFNNPSDIRWSKNVAACHYIIIYSHLILPFSYILLNPLFPTLLTYILGLSLWQKLENEGKKLTNEELHNSDLILIRLSNQGGWDDWVMQHK